MRHGDFFRYDLTTKDTGEARAFYTAVNGWTTQDVGTGGQDYTAFNLDGHGVAGLMPMPAGVPPGMPPTWLGYILVDDVDAMVKKIPAAGGRVLKGPVDVPGIIRFAVVADPDGAVFLVAKPHMAENFTPPPQHAPGTQGTFGWRELMAGDGKAVFGFYEKLFGWQKGDAVDMGAMGVYQLFNNGGEALGGMMTKPPQMPAPPHWGYYINVARVDATVAKVTGGGGKILHGPVEVPGGQWIVQCQDPQGAHINFVGPQR